MDPYLNDERDPRAMFGCLLYTLIAGLIMAWGYHEVWIALQNVWELPINK